MSKSSTLLQSAKAPTAGAIFSWGRSRKRGYILVATSLGVVFLLGAAGLSVDIGRMYITKTEAQAYVDSAALAASRQLDGTEGSISRATAAVAGDPGKWRFSTTPYTNVTVGFGTSEKGPFVATPPNPPTNYHFARVTATVNVPMYLIRVVSGPTSKISAAAIAGRQNITSFPGGEFPFSPYTRKGYPGAVPEDAVDPYGFRIGNQYTLHWGAPGNKSKCGTDADVPNLATNGNIRGYCCAGSAASAREAIVGEATEPVTIGQPLPMDNAQRDALNETIGQRVLVDSDSTATTYAQYRANRRGNNARVVMVPVNAGPPDYIGVGFAGFFLLNANKYTVLNGNDSACGEYIGLFLLGAPAPPPAGSGAYRIRLFQ